MEGKGIFSDKNWDWDRNWKDESLKKNVSSLYVNIHTQTAVCVIIFQYGWLQ